MTSFITTMFVNPTSSPTPSTSSMQSYPSPPKPLEPIHTLVESSSCIHIPLSSSTPSTPTRQSFQQQQQTSSPRLPPASPQYNKQQQQQQQSQTSPVGRFLYQALRSIPLPYYSAQSSPVKMDEKTVINDEDAYYRNSRTRAPFRPQKSGKGSTNWQLKQFAEATLGSGSLRKAVKLPEGEDEGEWLAVNVVDFYNQINLLYGSITEFCSPQSCPEMKATDEFEYLWQDSDQYKKPTKMAAPEYIEHLMTWVQSNIDNEAMFPSRIGVAFPRTFRPLILQIFKRLYRVYAHIYCHHYPVIINLGLEPHLNTSFKHYVLFVEEHGLAQGSRDFWGPLGDLVESMLRSD